MQYVLIRFGSVHSWHLPSQMTTNVHEVRAVERPGGFFEALQQTQNQRQNQQSGSLEDSMREYMAPVTTTTSVEGGMSRSSSYFSLVVDDGDDDDDGGGDREETLLGLEDNSQHR